MVLISPTIANEGTIAALYRRRQREQLRGRAGRKQFEHGQQQLLGDPDLRPGGEFRRHRTHHGRDADHVQFSGWSIANSGGASTVWRIYEGRTYPLLESFLTPLTVTANDAGKTYDGLAYSGGNGVTYSLTPGSNLLGTELRRHLAGAVDAGAYTIAPSGLYSNQQGYDIGYMDGTLTIAAPQAGAEAPTSSQAFMEARAVGTADLYKNLPASKEWFVVKAGATDLFTVDYSSFRTRHGEVYLFGGQPGER